MQNSLKLKLFAKQDCSIFLIQLVFIVKIGPWSNISYNQKFEFSFLSLKLKKTAFPIFIHCTKVRNDLFAFKNQKFFGGFLND